MFSDNLNLVVSVLSFFVVFNVSIVFPIVYWIFKTHFKISQLEHRCKERLEFEKNLTTDLKNDFKDLYSRIDDLKDLILNNSNTCSLRG